MASLYKINDEINRIISGYEWADDTHLVSLETGEVVDAEDVYNILVQLDIDKQEKLDAYAFVIKDNKATIDNISAEVKRLQELKKQLERTSKRLLDVLSFEYGGKSHKDKAGRYSVSFRKTKSCEIVDEEKIPSVFKVPQPAKISKLDVLNALKQGEEIPGAVLKEKLSCSVK